MGSIDQPGRGAPFVSATAVGFRSADAADSTTGSSEAAGLPGQKDPKLGDGGHQPGNTTVLTFGQDPYIATRRLERKAASVSPKGAQRTVAGGAGIHGFMGAHEQPSFSELVQR
jgi:hypothetical protein